MKVLSAADPKSPKIATEAGLLELSSNNRTAARAIFTRTLTTKSRIYGCSGRPGGHGPAGQTARSGQGTGGRRYSRESPGHAATYARRSVHASQGDLDSAAASFRKVIELDPGNLQAYGTLGQLYAKQGRLGEAVAEFEHFVSKQPNSVPGLTCSPCCSKNRRTSLRRRRGISRRLRSTSSGGGGEQPRLDIRRAWRESRHRVAVRAGSQGRAAIEPRSERHSRMGSITRGVLGRSP
jgi:tetratricopeptide (TPR) repeat protein